MPRRAPSRPARRTAPTPPKAPARAPVRRWWLLATTALLPVTGTALAQSPTGGQVVAGQAAIAQSGNRTTITQRTDRAAIEWQQFNVGSQSTVQFVQPNQGSWTLNRVTGPDPSVIAGRIQANGGVAIVNQSGMVFAGGAQVDVGSLIASAANITNNNFMAGRMVFDGAPRPGARVENRGTITVADRGLAALVGPGVSNSGVIRANLGRVALGAAETFVLDLAGDGLIGIDVTRAVTAAPDGGAALVTNSGVIEANGGSVLITAHAASGLVEDLVRNTGRIEANTVGARAGEVALRAQGGGVRQDGSITVMGGDAQQGGRVAVQATGQVTLGATARIDASGGAGGGRALVGTTGRGRDQTMAARTTIERGATIRADATRTGHGGEILVNSTERTEMRGTLSAQGGAAGGNGGFIEVSGQSAFVLDGIVDLRAAQGDLGTFLLDPRNILIADAGANPPSGSVTETPADLAMVGGSVTGAGAVSATSGANGEWVRITPDVIEGYAAGNIVIEASRQIVIASAVDRSTAGDLTLTAGLSGAAGAGNITQNAGASISVNGVLTMQTAAGAISLGADLRATGVVLSASGNISQTGGTIAHRLAGTELPLSVTASGATASVSLNAAGNGILALGATSAGTNFALSGEVIRLAGALAGDSVALAATTGAIGLEADIRATELSLTAVTGITQTGGTIAHRAGADTALPLTASVSGTGDIVLDQANGSLQLRTGSTAAGDMQVTSAERLEIGSAQTVTVNGAATLTVTGAGNPLLLAGSLLAESATLAAAGDITQTGGAIAHVTAGTPMTLAVTATGAGSVDLTSAANGTFALAASSAAGDFALTGQAIAMIGPLAGNVVALTATAGALAVDSDIAATGVTLVAETGIAQGAGIIFNRDNVDFGLPITIIVTGTGDAVLEQGNGNLQIMSGGTADGLVRIGSSRYVELVVGETFSVAGAATLTTQGNGSPIVLNGSLFADSVTLSAPGDVTQAATGVLARRAADGGADLAAALPLTANVTGNNNALSLAGSNGALQVTGASTEDGAVSLRGRSVTIAGAVTAEANGGARSDLTVTATLGGVAFDAVATARNATVNAAGAVTQTVALDLGGTGGGRLRVRGASGMVTSAAGSVALTESNAVAELDARSSGALAFTAAGDLTVTQARGAGVTLAGSALTVPDGVAGIVATGSGDVAVTADSLAVPGTITAPDGRTIALRTNALDLSGGSVSAGTTGTVEIGPRGSDIAVQVGTAGNPSGTMELETADLEAITAGTLRIGRTTFGAVVTANGVSVVDDVAPEAALSLVSANGVAVNAGVTARSVRMETTAGDIALGAVAVRAEGPGAAITLLAAGGITQAAGGLLVAPDGTTVDLIAHSAAGLALAGSGDFRLAGGITPSGATGERSLFAAFGVDFTTTGAITVAAPVESTGAAPTVSLAGRSIAIEAPIITSALAGLSLTASAGDAASTITQTAAGTIRTGTLTLAAEGAIDLSLAPNEVASLGTVTFTQGFGYRSTTGFAVAGPLAPADAGNANITIIADTGDILLQAPIGAGTGTVRLEATTGDITQNAAGAAITAGRLELTAGGDAMLDPALAADRNAVAVLGTSSVGGTLAFNAAGDLALDGTIGQAGAGGAVRIAAGGTLTQNAGGVLGFDSITLMATGQMTLRGTIGVDQAIPVSAVRLGTDGGITQEAGGRILADSLGIRAVGDVLLAAGTNDVRLVAAATNGVFALDTAGALATAILSQVPLTDGTSTTIGGVLGSSVTLSAADLTINPAGLGGFLGAGAFASAVGGALTLRADTLHLLGLVGAGGTATFDGTIDIAPRTLGRAVVVGGLDAGALSLSAADLLRLYALDIVIGRAEAGAGDLAVAGAASVLSGVQTVLLQGGGITLDGVFTLPTAGGVLTLNAATGDIAQDGGAISAPTLVAQAAAGSVLLDGMLALNQVGRLAGSVAAGETFAFRGAGSYVIAAPGIDATNGTVRLLAPLGGITQALGAPILADRLSASALGAVLLDGGGAAAGPADLNHVATLGPSDGTSVTFRNAEALTVEGVTANGFAGSAVVLEAPGLTIAGDIIASGADGRVILRSGADFDAPVAGTSIAQTGGIIRTRDLSASAGAAIDLARDNEIGRLAAGQGAAAVSADSIVLRDGGTLSLTDAAGGIEVAARVNAGNGSAVQVVADGLTVAPGLAGTVFYAPGGVVRFLPFTAGATIGLGGGGDTTTYATSLLQRVDAGRLVIGGDDAGTITLRQALNLLGPAGPETLELRSGDDLLASGFNLSVARISAFAAGDVAIGTAVSAIGRVVAGEGTADGITSGGTVSLATAGTLAVDAAIRADGATVTLQAGDVVLAPGAAVQTGAVAGSTVTIRSTNGAGLALGVTDAAAGLSQQEIALLDARGGRLRLEGSAIDLAGTVAVGASEATILDLAATGAVTQSGGTLAATALRVDGASVQIDRGGNSLPQIEATATGNISIATDGATSIRGTRSTGGDVAIAAGSIALSDAAGIIAVQAAGTASLTATAGDVTGTAPLAAVQAAALNAPASGAVTLTGDNAVGTLAAVAGSGVTFGNTIALTAGAAGAGGSAVAGDVTLTAPSLRLNDVLATGTVDLTAGAGTIDQSAGARLDAGILRAAATGSVILDGANPDGSARNRIVEIDALSASAHITVRNALALTLDIPLTVADSITLEAPTLTIGANLAATGPIGLITLRTGSFDGGLPSGGDIIQTGGTISASRVAALAGGTVSLDMPGNAIGALGGGGSASGDPLGLGIEAGVSATVRSDGFAGNDWLNIISPLVVRNGGTLTLRANDLVIGTTGAFQVPGGTVLLLPVTTDAGIGYVLGGALGSTTAGRITLDSVELDRAFSGTGTPVAQLILGELGATGSVDIAGAVALPRLGQLTLLGDGALTQGAGTLIDVAALRAIFPNGTVLLDPGSAGNRIAALEGIVAGGDVNIRGGAGMMELRDGGGGAAITVIPSGRAITLRADDVDVQAAVQAPGGVINILPETAGRAVTLGGSGVGTLALGTAEIARLGGGGAALDAPAALRLRIGGSADGTVTAGDIRIVGDVPLRGRVGVLDLLAGSPGIAGGAVGQTGGTVDVVALTGSAQGDFRVDGANMIDQFAAIRAGTQRGGPPTTLIDADIALRTTGDASLGHVTATRNVSIEAGGTLTTGTVTTLPDLPGSIGIAAPGISAGRQVRLTAGDALAAGGVVAPVILLEGGTVRLTNLIQGSSAVTIDSAGAVTQDAGALVVTGLFTLNGGSVALPEDNQIIELDGLVATGPVLSLNTVLPLLVSGAVSAVGSLNFTTAQGLTVADTGSITVTGGPGSATLQANGAIGFAGRLSTSGAARLTAGGALAFTGMADIGAALTLGAGAGMTLGGGISAVGGIAAGALGAMASTATLATTGALELTAGTTLDLGGSWQASDTATFTAGGLLTYRATGTGTGDVTLVTPNAIAATAGSGIAAAGTVRLDAGTNLSALGTVTGGPLVTLRAGTGAMTLAGSIGATGALRAEAATGLTTGAAIATGGDALLTAGGAVVASNRIAAGGALDVVAGGAMTLAGSWSAGAAARVSAGGTLTYGAVGSGAGDVTLTASGAFGAASGSAITGAGTIAILAGTDLAALGALSAGGDVDLRAALGAMTLAGTIGATNGVSATARLGLTTSAVVNAGQDASLVAGGALGVTNRIAVGRDLGLRAGAGIAADGALAAGRDALLTAGGAIGIAGSLGAGRDATLSAGAGLQSSAQVQAGSALTITAGGDIALAALHRADGTLAVTAGGGLVASGTVAAGTAATLRAGQSMTLQGLVQAGTAVTLGAGGNLASAATVTAGGDMAATIGGDISHTGTLAANTVLLSAGGTLTQSGQVSAGGMMRLSGGAIASSGTLTAGGPISLAAAAGLAQSGTLQSAQAVSLSAGGDLSLSGQAIAATDMTLSAGGTASLTGGKITAGGEVRLNAGQGTTLSGFQIDPTIIAIETGGTLLVQSSELVSGESIRLAGGNVTLRGNTITTGTLDVDAAGNLTLDGGRYVIGRAVGFSAPGGIATTSVIVVGPRDGVLPAVVFDTRGPGALPDPLTVVEPDQPGLPANQQPTQVRLPGTEAPGAFGPASSAAAGPMQIAIDAGRSAIFLLLDGGSATGEIVSAGRLAIHGTGGSAELTGALIDVSGTPIAGASAARFADSTRPASTGALTRYRINGCVVSSINCIVPSQVLTIPQAPPQRVDIRLWGGAVTDPDVQLPNVADEDE